MTQMSMVAARRPCRSDARPFTGRDGIIGIIRQRIVSGSPLVTVTGGPGFGKTRVGEVLFKQSLNWAHWTGGRWFISLSAEPEQHLDRIAGGLGLAALPPEPDRAAAHMGAHFAALGPALLILDLPGSARGRSDVLAGLIEGWLETAPELVVLLLARDSLGLASETRVVLGPLEAADAVDLFTELAENARPGCSEVRGWADGVPALVKRLDCNPLALECAAARMAILTPASLLMRLDERLTVLSGPRRPFGGPSGLAEALAELWDSLEPADRRALARLTVINEPAALDVIEHLISLLGEPPHAGLERLERLVRASLIAETATPSGPRYSLYEMIRGFATESLRAYPAEVSAAEEALCAYCLDLVRVQAPRIKGPEARSAQQVLFDSYGLILGAVRRIMAREPASTGSEAAARLLIGVEALMRRCGSPRWVVDAMQDLAIRTCLPRALRVQVGVVLGGHLAREGALEAARDVFARAEREAREEDVPGLLGCVLYRTMPLSRVCGGEATEARVREGVACLRAAGMVFELAEAQTWLALFKMWSGALAEAQVLFDEAIVAMRRHDLVGLMPQALSNRGQLHAHMGDWAAATACVREGVAYAARDGFGLTLAILMTNLGDCLLRQGLYHEARDAFEQAKEHAIEVGDARRQGVCAGHLAWLAVLDGAQREAAALCEEAAKAFRRAWRDPAAECLNLALWAVADAGLGRFGEAHARLCEAESTLAGAGGAEVSRALAIYRLMVEHLRGARTTSRVSEVRARLDVLRQPSGGGSGLERYRVEDAARLLEAALVGSGEATPGAVRADITPSQDVGALDRLRVAGDGSWFQAPGADRVSLARKASARKAVVALVANASRAAKAPLSVDALFEIGWPGDRTPEPHRSNRVYVLIAKLRAAGLAPRLRHDGEGYRLDPEALEVVEAAP